MSGFFWTQAKLLGLVADYVILVAAGISLIAAVKATARRAGLRVSCWRRQRQARRLERRTHMARRPRPVDTGGLVVDEDDDLMDVADAVQEEAAPLTSLAHCSTEWTALDGRQLDAAVAEYQRDRS